MSAPEDNRLLPNQIGMSDVCTSELCAPGPTSTEEFSSAQLKSSENNVQLELLPFEPVFSDTFDGYGDANFTKTKMWFHKLLAEERDQRVAETTAMCARIDALEKFVLLQQAQGSTDQMPLESTTDQKPLECNDMKFQELVMNGNAKKHPNSGLFMEGDPPEKLEECMKEVTAILRSELRAEIAVQLSSAQALSSAVEKCLGCHPMCMTGDFDPRMGRLEVNEQLRCQNEAEARNFFEDMSSENKTIITVDAIQEESRNGTASPQAHQTLPPPVPPQTGVLLHGERASSVDTAASSCAALATLHDTQASSLGMPASSFHPLFRTKPQQYGDILSSSLVTIATLPEIDCSGVQHALDHSTDSVETLLPNTDLNGMVDSMAADCCGVPSSEDGLDTALKQAFGQSKKPPLLRIDDCTSPPRAGTATHVKTLTSSVLQRPPLQRSQHQQNASTCSPAQCQTSSLEGRSCSASASTFANLINRTQSPRNFAKTFHRGTPPTQSLSWSPPSECRKLGSGGSQSVKPAKESTSSATFNVSSHTTSTAASMVGSSPASALEAFSCTKPQQHSDKLSGSVVAIASLPLDHSTNSVETLLPNRDLNSTVDSMAAECCSVFSSEDGLDAALKQTFGQSKDPPLQRSGPRTSPLRGGTPTQARALTSSLLQKPPVKSAKQAQQQQSPRTSPQFVRNPTDVLQNGGTVPPLLTVVPTIQANGSTSSTAQCQTSSLVLPRVPPATLPASHLAQIVARSESCDALPVGEEQQQSCSTSAPTFARIMNHAQSRRGFARTKSRGTSPLQSSSCSPRSQCRRLGFDTSQCVEPAPSESASSAVVGPFSRSPMLTQRSAISKPSEVGPPADFCQKTAAISRSPANSPKPYYRITTDPLELMTCNSGVLLSSTSSKMPASTKASMPLTPTSTHRSCAGERTPMLTAAVPAQTEGKNQTLGESAVELQRSHHLV